MSMWVLPEDFQEIAVKISSHVVKTRKGDLINKGIQCNLCGELKKEEHPKFFILTSANHTDVHNGRAISYPNLDLEHMGCFRFVCEECRTGGHEYTCETCGDEFVVDVWSSTYSSGSLLPTDNLLRNSLLPIYLNTIRLSTQFQGLDLPSALRQECPRCLMQKVSRCHCGRSYLGLTEQVRIDGYCSSCSKQNWTCPKCKKRNVHKNPYEENVCTQCSPVLRMKEWSYKAPPKVFLKHPGEKTKLFFGMEVEICTPEADPEKLVHNLLKREGGKEETYYSVWDGTVSPGFELVFYPMSFEFFNYYNFNWLFELEKYRMKGHSNQGIHIHMSREAFTPLHIFKFVNWIYREIPFVTFIGERLPTGYSQALLDLKLSKAVRAEPGCAHIGGDKEFYNYKRRRMINMINKNTIEARFFNTTLREKPFRKNVEFLAALYDFTKNNGLGTPGPDEFLEYVDKNSSMFPNLLIHIGQWKGQKDFYTRMTTKNREAVKNKIFVRK